MGDLQDGQIAVIVKWICGTYIGVIVQRYEDSLVVLGRPSGESWPQIFGIKYDWLTDGTCRVEVLGEGTVFGIQ